MKPKLRDLVLAILASWIFCYFKNKTLTSLSTQAMSHLIVADIYGGFCRPAHFLPNFAPVGCAGH